MDIADLSGEMIRTAWIDDVTLGRYRVEGLILELETGKVVVFYRTANGITGPVPATVSMAVTVRAEQPELAR